MKTMPEIFYGHKMEVLTNFTPVDGITKWFTIIFKCKGQWKMYRVSFNLFTYGTPCKTREMLYIRVTNFAINLTKDIA